MHASPALSYRPFEATDAGVLAGWLRAAGLGVPDHVEAQVWVDRVRGDPSIVCLTGCSPAGERVGFIRLDIGPDRAAEVTVVVAPGLRRRGIGRGLMTRTLAEARQRGLRRLLAQVQEGNRPALGFFADAGFEAGGCDIPGFVQLVRFVHSAERQPPLEISP